MNVKREDCVYTYCFCEENVYQLCNIIEKNYDIDTCHVVFISNKNKQIPVWCQRSGNNSEQPVVWDYHVILLHEDKSTMRVQVYDFDTSLDFPCSLPNYVKNALRNEKNLKPAFCRYFRIIPALYFLKTFASDRSHMKDKSGNWLKPPPNYSPIKTKRLHNEFI